VRKKKKKVMMLEGVLPLRFLTNPQLLWLLSG